MDTEMLDKFIGRHNFSDLDEEALRLIVSLAFEEGKTFGVKVCQAIINGAKL